MWPNPQEAADFVTFTEEILNGKLHILSSVTIYVFSFLELRFWFTVYFSKSWYQQFANTLVIFFYFIFELGDFVYKTDILKAIIYRHIKIKKP